MQTKPTEVTQGVKDEQTCYNACKLKHDEEPKSCGFYVYRAYNEECTLYASTTGYQSQYFDCDIKRGPNTPIYDAKVCP